MRRAAAAQHEGRFLTNLLNPSIATFYLIVMPQFIPRDAPIARSVLLLTTVHVGLALTWHLVWAAAGGTLWRTLAQGRARRVLDVVTAGRAAVPCGEGVDGQSVNRAWSRGRGSRFAAASRCGSRDRVRRPRPVPTEAATQCLERTREPRTREPGPRTATGPCWPVWCIG